MEFTYPVLQITFYVKDNIISRNEYQVEKKVMIVRSLHMKIQNVKTPLYEKTTICQTNHIQRRKSGMISQKTRQRVENGGAGARWDAARLPPLCQLIIGHFP